MVFPELSYGSTKQCTLLSKQNISWVITYDDKRAMRWEEPCGNIELCTPCLPCQGRGSLGSVLYWCR